MIYYEILIFGAKSLFIEKLDGEKLGNGDQVGMFVSVMLTLIMGSLPIPVSGLNTSPTPE